MLNDRAAGSGPALLPRSMRRSNVPPRSTGGSRRLCVASAGSAGLTELRHPAPRDPRCHHRERFDSGEPVLDGWLRRHAGHSRRRGTAATKVIVDANENIVA